MLNYAIVGGGRLARHFSYYFQLLDIPHKCWARDPDSSFNTFRTAGAETRLRQVMEDADRVLLLVSDHAITALLKQYPFLHEKPLIHCSGSLSIPGVAGVHPLMTFADSMYEPDVYRSIPFVHETGYEFDELFPALPNPHFPINVEEKARYHAMCVMAGNFAQLMWKGISESFENRFEWPADILKPYLRQVAENFVQDPKSSLTGPLVRNDHLTIERNINALEGDPLREIYTAFLRFHQGTANRDPDSGGRMIGEAS